MYPGALIGLPMLALAVQNAWGRNGPYWYVLACLEAA
jgi:hypothetical protein